MKCKKNMNYFTFLKKNKTLCMEILFRRSKIYDKNERNRKRENNSDFYK